MNDNNETSSSTPTDSTNPPTEASAPAATAAAEPEAPKVSVPPPPDPLTAITGERDKLKDQLLRTLADFDNYRKRVAREKQEDERRGRERVLSELLPVFDNLERAAAFARPGADPKAIADGVQMVLKLFEDALGKTGGVRLKVVGQPFDPSQHEALQQIESDEFPAGTVTQELVAGYKLGEKLLRPAMVVVSKGPPPPPTSDN